jgi:hypothetical protein
MVRVRTEKATYYHEPRYTEEESMEIYRLASYQGGGATILHGPVEPAPQPQKSPRQQQEE